MSYQRLTATELLDIAIQLEEIRKKLSFSGNNVQTESLNIMILIVETQAANRALYELREAQRLIKEANNVAVTRTAAREAEEKAQKPRVQEDRADNAHSWVPDAGKLPRGVQTDCVVEQVQSPSDEELASWSNEGGADALPF